MSQDKTNTQNPAPDAALRSLDILVGTWRVSGGTQGHITYEWVDGGFFLIQHVELGQDGDVTKGMEIIGRERTFGAAEPSEHIKSRFYGSKGETFDYVYELEGSRLTIWGGEKGSPAYFRGTFSEDENTLTGSWVWPGGGYESIATRVH